MSSTTAPKIKVSPPMAFMLVRAGVREGLDYRGEAPSCGNLSLRCGCAIGHGLARIFVRAA